MKCLFFFVVSVFLASCATTGDISKLENEISQQKAEVSYLKGRVDAMSDDIARLVANQQTIQSSAAVPSGAASQTAVPSSTAVSGVQLDTTSGRCQAITTAGTQCTRKAQPGSKYCWQHQNYEKSTSSGTTDRQIYTGPRGGQYYINSNGKKVYIRKKK